MCTAKHAPREIHQWPCPKSALSELLEAFRTGDGVDLIGRPCSFTVTSAAGAAIPTAWPHPTDQRHRDLGGQRRSLTGCCSAYTSASPKGTAGSCDGPRGTAAMSPLPLLWANCSRAGAPICQPCGESVGSCEEDDRHGSGSVGGRHQPHDQKVGIPVEGW